MSQKIKINDGGEPGPQTLSRLALSGGPLPPPSIRALVSPVRVVARVLRPALHAAAAVAGGAVHADEADAMARAGTSRAARAGALVSPVRVVAWVLRRA